MKDLVVGAVVGVVAIGLLGVSKACFKKSGDLIKPAFAGVADALGNRIGSCYDSIEEKKSEEVTEEEQ